MYVEQKNDDFMYAKHLLFAMRTLGFNPTEVDIKKMKSEIGIDDSDFIAFEEFLMIFG